MRLFCVATILSCLFSSIIANPHPKKELGKRLQTGVGCSWCTPGPWLYDPQCSTYEYSAVASSLRNPPTGIIFDATAFCSEFLRPLVTKLSIINVTSAITTQTSEVISLTMFTPTTTSTLPTGTISTNSTAPAITASPKLEAAVLKPRDFTVPEYLEGWYFYGRLDPGCSCLITSASSSLLLSVTETDTIYNTTVSTTVTDVYTIYP